MTYDFFDAAKSLEEYGKRPDVGDATILLPYHQHPADINVQTRMARLLIQPGEMDSDGVRKPGFIARAELHRAATALFCRKCEEPPARRAAAMPAFSSYRIPLRAAPPCVKRMACRAIERSDYAARHGAGG